VKIVSDPLFELAVVMGKVFADTNGNGWQDVGEPPLPYVKLVTSAGQQITTDIHGRYHLGRMPAGRMVIRLDQRSLPFGSMVVGRSSKVVDIRPGLPVKVSFAVQTPDAPQQQSTPFKVEQLPDAPQPRLNLATFGPVQLNPAANGLVQPLEIRLYSNYPTFIDRWQVQVLESFGGRVVQTFNGDRSDLFSPISWNGLTNAGQTLDTATRYMIQLIVTDESGHQASTLAQVLQVMPWQSDQQLPLPRSGSVNHLQWLQQLEREDRTLTRDIRIVGKTVRISGDLFFSGVRLSRGEEVLIEVPNYRGSNSNARLLLQGGSLDDGSSYGTELILPHGKLKLEVLQQVSPDAGQASHVPSDRGRSWGDQIIEFLIPRAYGADHVPQHHGISRHNSAWLQQQPGSAYTIQLLSGFNKPDVHNFIVRHGLDESQLSLFSVLVNGEPRYSLIQGIYTDYRSARQAMAQLPDNLLVVEPWIRPLSAIQQMLNNQPSPAILEQELNIMDLEQELNIMETKVTDEYFLVGIVDGELGYSKITGNLELASSGDQRYNAGIWKDGKVQLYFKGTVSGQYLVTASVDTERDVDDLFRNLDPNASYAVYGDNSSVTDLAGEAYGMLYLLIEKDTSWAKWGQLQASLGKTELARFQRTLQGGQLHYESAQAASTSGAPVVTQVDLFAGNSQLKTAHNEFLVTGSSLYYLKHQQTLSGSLHLKLEQRNRVTGTVKSSQELMPDADYEFDAAAGRITFWTPPQQSPQQLIGASTVDETFLVADYSYSVAGDWSKGVNGGRVQHQLSDRIVIGVTHIAEEQQDGRYQLQGIDSDIQLGEHHQIHLEAARSESRANPQHVSINGGLNWAIDEADIASNDQNTKGDAVSIQGSARHPKQQVLLDYYLRRVSEHFSSNATHHQQGQEALGIALKHQYNEALSVQLSHDQQTQLSVNNSQNRSGAEKTYINVLHANYRVDDQLSVTSELKHQRELNAADSISSSGTLAMEGRYQVNQKTSVTLAQQTSISGSSSASTQAGIHHQLTPALAFDSQVSHDQRGNGYQVGGRYALNDRMTLSGGMQQDTAGQHAASAGLGYSADKLSVEAKLQQDSSGQTSSHLGTGYQPDDDTQYKLSLQNQHGSGADASSQSVAVGASHKTDPDTTIDTGVSLSLLGSDQRVGVNGKVSRNLGNGQSAYAAASRYTAQADDQYSIGHEVGLGGDLNNRWAAFFSLGQGYVYRFDGGKDRLNNLALGTAYSQRDMAGTQPLQGRLRYERQHKRGQDRRNQQRVKLELKGHSSSDTTLFTNLDWSEGTNLDTGLVDLRNNRFDLGFSYRPVSSDQFNMIAKYSWLDNQQPANQVGITGLEQEQAQVIAMDLLYDLDAEWNISSRLALRRGKEKITDMPWANRHLWLVASRLGYRFRPDSQVNLEYRYLGDVEAKDHKAGTVLEFVERFNDDVEAAIGLNRAGFSDDLGDLDYARDGVYLRISGILED
jgi:hypothetical protein